jgi:hypothetical protein
MTLVVGVYLGIRFPLLLAQMRSISIGLSVISHTSLARHDPGVQLLSRQYDCRWVTYGLLPASALCLANTSLSYLASASRFSSSILSLDSSILPKPPRPEACMPCAGAGPRAALRDRDLLREMLPAPPRPVAKAASVCRPLDSAMSLSCRSSSALSSAILSVGFRDGDLIFPAPPRPE